MSHKIPKMVDGQIYDGSNVGLPGIEFKDFILGFRQCTFLFTTLKCIDFFHKIWDSSIKSRIQGRTGSP